MMIAYPKLFKVKNTKTRKKLCIMFERKITSRIISIFNEFGQVVKMLA